MSIMKKLVNKIKDKKGITGTDIAAAITVIVLTAGIVTAIYVNAMNKSKDNLRYANAVRIATNIMENIQSNPYEYLTSICASGNQKNVKGNNAKIFGTKVPNGYEVTVIAKPASGANYDVARDVTINVKYKANMTYKTVTLNSVKEKELMDMTNSPDFSLIPGYNTANTYFYPVIPSGAANTFKITTTNDINWYDYEEGKYALVYKTTNGNLNVGSTTTDKSNIFAWIPRYVAKTSGTGKENIQFLYGTSDYSITLNKYNDKLFSYGVSYPSGVAIQEGSIPNKFGSGFAYNNVANSFAQNDGLSGVWYNINASGNSTIVTNAFNGLNAKIAKTNF